MINEQGYLRLRFKDGGRERPEVDCWGLYRLIVGETTGVWLADYEGVTEALSIARTLKRERCGGSWSPVTIGAERPLDLVLMNGQVGKGRAATLAPLHVGCVTRPGRMLDIEEGNSVLVRRYRDTAEGRAHDKARVRVLGVWRAAAVAEWWDGRIAA